MKAINILAWVVIVMAFNKVPQPDDADTHRLQ